MKLVKATAHYMYLTNGEMVKYLRLVRSNGRMSVGSSIMDSRFSPEFIAAVESMSGNGGVE